MKTPVTEEGMKLYDHLSPEQAALAAWHNPGPNPLYHSTARIRVEEAMPLLARALDRMLCDG